MAYEDYRECSTCGAKVTGRGFVAALKGIDPKLCDKCGKRTLEKKPCPPEIEADLARSYGSYKSGGGTKPKVQRAGDLCAPCAARVVMSKLVMKKDEVDLGNGRRLNSLVCPTCFTTAGIDPDDPRLLEASKKASEL